jgi:DNA/RNA-binding protein KIN17
MLVVGEHANSYIEQYSRDFQNDFLALLSRRWGTKRVRANQVYQEFIQDKHHSHMNATRWVTLTGFVQYLGRTGICHVDETEKGWYIAWIDNSPKALAKQDAAMKRERQDMGDEERQRRFLNEQIERARALEAEKQRDSEDPEASTSKTAEEEEPVDIAAMQPIKMSFGATAKGKERERGEAANDTAAETVSTAAETVSTAADSTKAEGIKSEASPEAAGSVGDKAQEETPKADSAPLALKPKGNPLKMMGSKSNPLKANPLKPKAAKPGDAPAASTAGTKRPMSAVEAIAQEEMERKRRKEQGTWSRGHGQVGLQRR